MLPGLSGLKRSVKSVAVFEADVNPPMNVKTCLKFPEVLARKKYRGREISYAAFLWVSSWR